MSLLARQQAFRDAIAAADDEAEPASTGMAIYRDAYRGRLLAALEVSFERTRRWVGEAAFVAAACHFILSHPPVGWTLDEYGAEFPSLLAALFAEEPDVAELAWLEWHLQKAFAAKDRPTLDPAELAAAGLSGEDWAGLRFAMAAGFAARPVAGDCGALWEALAGDGAGDFTVPPVDGVLLVWRAGVRPCWRIASPEEAGALERLAGGAAFGEIAAHADTADLGTWFAQWLGEGVFARALHNGDAVASAA